MYIELHARSAFSFLEGSSLPEDLMSTCAQLHMPAMALLDTDGVYGAPRFHLAAKKLGIKAHIGAEVTRRFTTESRSHREEQSQINNHKSTIEVLRVSACPERQPKGVSVVNSAFLSSFPPAPVIKISAA